MNPTIFLLAAVAFVVVAVMTVVGPLLPLVAEEFGRSVGQAGVIVTAFALPYGGCQIIFGPVGDRYGKLRVIAVALALATVFVAGCGVANSLTTLAVMRFACGITMAATIPLAMAWIADEIPAAVRQPVIGRYVNGLVLGQIAGGVLGGFAAEYLDWRYVFFLLAVCCAGIAAALWNRAAGADARREPVTRRWRDVLALYGSLFTDRRSREVIITGTLEGFLIFGVIAYFGAFLRHAHGLDYARIGLILSAYGLGGMIYAAAVYRLVRLLGERRMVWLGACTLGGCFVVLVLATRWELCAPILLIAGFGFYLFHNTMQVQATELSQQARGTAVSLWVFMLFLGQGLGVVFFGLLIDAFGYSSAFVCAGLALALLGVWFSRRMVPHSAS